MALASVKAVPPLFGIAAALLVRAALAGQWGGVTPEAAEPRLGEPQAASDLLEPEAAAPREAPLLAAGALAELRDTAWRPATPMSARPRRRGPSLQQRNASQAARPKTTQSRLQKATPSADEADKIRAKNGYFLGFSRDAWIVLALMVGGLVISLAMILSSVGLAVEWRSTYLGSELQCDEKGNIIEPRFPVGFGQRLLGRDRNARFAYLADLALRGSVMSGLLALTYWVDAFKVVNTFGWSMQYVVVIIVFSVYMDMGNTACLAWYNFYGTLLPTLNVFFLWGWCPHGTTQAGVFSPTWWFGFVDFIAFNFAFLALNVPVGVRMFALSWQAYFSMAFLNPHNTTKFSTGFDDIILQGAAVGPLVGTIFGCVLGLVVVGPSPWGYSLTGLGHAQEQAIKLTWEEGKLWKAMVDYFCKSDQTVEIDRLAGEAMFLETEVQKLDEFMSATWWECFDYGKPGRIRAHILQFQRKMSPMHDWLRGTIETLRKEDFNAQHGELMQRVGAEMRQLADACSKLMYRSVQLAIAGFSESNLVGVEAVQGQGELRELKANIAAVAAAQASLAKAFAKARGEVWGPAGLTADGLGEHYFCFALASYGEYATEFAEYLLSDHRAPGCGIIRGCYRGVMDTLAFNSLNFMMRTSIGFFGAWALGFFGMPGGLMGAYDSVPAGTTAYLMAAEGKGGSALMKNIARFQGVGGGTIGGQLLFNAFISCAWYSGFIGFVIMVISVFFSLYLYYSSANFGYVGLLCASYFAQHMMQSCGALQEDDSVYTAIIEQTMAIICVTVGDMLIGNKSSGKLAADALFTCTGILESNLRLIFGLEAHDLAVSKTDRKSGLLARLQGADLNAEHDKSREVIDGKFMEAKSVGDEAPLEPRWYRMPFKENLWDNLMTNGGNIATKVKVMEYAIINCEKARIKTKSSSPSPLEHLVQSENLASGLDYTMEYWKRVFDFARTLMNHETNLPMDHESGYGSKRGETHSPEATPAGIRNNLYKPMDVAPILADFAKTVPKAAADKPNLVMDEFCLAGTILQMVTSIAPCITGMKEICLQDPGVSFDDDDDE